MTGMSFATKGGPGPATQTVWFGTIVDRLNMLTGSQYPTSPYNTTIAPAHYGNLWSPFNGSFTSFTTAPDGTSNSAQLFVEDSSNNKHFIQATSLPGPLADGAMSAGFDLGRIRMAGFFKNSGRRVGFQVQTISENLSLTVVFDLAGGQVGVAASVTGSATHGILTATGTQIIPAANGFFLCIQDFYYKDDNGALIVASCFLDNGTGTGALSQTYTGNGTSGTYAWRTNMMPVAAYGINNTVFFDDFLSTSTIDVLNTKAQGFNWYPSGGVWLNYLGNAGSPFSPSAYTVSGSVLTLLASANPSGGAVMFGSVTQVNAAAGTYSGQGYGGGPPMLMESSIAFPNYSVQETGSIEATFWSTSLEWIVAQGQGQTVALASQPKFPGRELDLSQGSQQSVNRPSTDALIYIGVSGAFSLPGNGAILTLTGVSNMMAGYPQWESTWDYGTIANPGQQGFVVQSGVIYQTAANAHNINHQPPNATFWTVKSVTQAPILSDLTQFHLHSHLIIPYWGQPGVSKGMAQQPTFTQFGSISGSVHDPAVGVKMSFYDGLWCNTSGFWGPNVSFNYASGDQASYLWASDNAHMTIWLSPGQAQNIAYDYVRIMQ